MPKKKLERKDKINWKKERRSVIYDCKKIEGDCQTVFKTTKSQVMWPVANNVASLINNSVGFWFA